VACTWRRDLALDDVLRDLKEDGGRDADHEQQCAGDSLGGYACAGQDGLYERYG
jgi:hypothetical protein